MKGGPKVVLPALAIAITGCAGDGGELGIRAVPDPLTKATQSGNPLLADARGLLALGSLGLAIEAYRKVLRERPDSVEALAGLAECYDRMGRHDLSRAKYEAALAIAPRNAILLRTFAASLERQGRVAAGKALRVEAEAADVADVAALVQTVPATAAQAVTQAAPAVEARATASSPVLADAKPAPRPAAAQTAVAGSTGSVTLKLPPARMPPPAVPDPAIAAGSVTVKLPPAALPEPQRPSAVRAQAGPAKAAAAPVRQGPRLERLSLGEVALVSMPQPRWRTEVVHRTALSTTVRFVPLAQLRRDAGVRLLNAARHHGLAARTRLLLNRKGWARVSIGDSPRVRERSLVLYSDASAQAARRLASDFGFLIARDARPGPLTILLGRDAVHSTLARS